MKLIDLMELSSYTECRFYTADGHNLERDQFDEKYHLYDEAEWTFEELLEKEVTSVEPRDYRSFKVTLKI